MVGGSSCRPFRLINEAVGGEIQGTATARARCFGNSYESVLSHSVDAVNVSRDCLRFCSGVVISEGAFNPPKKPNKGAALNARALCV